MKEAIRRNIVLWNLRGKAQTLDKLMPVLINRVKDRNFDVIICDPIYKIITGDENSATAMAEFTNYFDSICAETGCSVIYSHHHSKGAQGGKKAMDRASGSGVFARDADALLDMTELVVSDEDMDYMDPGTKAYRIESTLREFRNITPLNIWFSYPLHSIDSTGILDKCAPSGSYQAGRQKNSKSKTTDQANDDFRRAFEVCEESGDVTIGAMAKQLKLSDKTIYDRIKKTDGEFILDPERSGVIIRTNKVDLSSSGLL